MAEIAATLGITSTALYRHYRNKSELLELSVLEALEATREIIARPVDLDDLMDSLIHIVLDRRGVSALWQREARYLSEEVQRQVWDLLREIEVRARAGLRAARPDISESDAEMLSWCLLGMFDSVSHHAVTLPRDRFEWLLRDLGHRLVGTELTTSEPLPERTVAPIVPQIDSVLDEHSRRERLLAAAARLFSEKGYPAVSIDDIGAASGITGPSVYYHFSSKSELLSELVDTGARVTEEYVARALAEVSTPLDACRTMMSYYLSFAFTHRELVWAMVTELTHMPPATEATHRARQRAGVMAWVGALRDVRPELDEDGARIIVQAVIMIINDVVRLPELRRRPSVTSELSAIGVALQAPNRTAR